MVDVEHRFVCQTWHAPITAPALLALWEDLATDPRAIASFDMLIDLRSVRVELTSNEVRHLAHVARQQPRSRHAIVTGTDVDFGLMRMFELFAALGGREYGVFRSLDDACEWLGNVACCQIEGEQRTRPLSSNELTG